MYFYLGVYFIIELFIIASVWDNPLGNDAQGYVRHAMRVLSHGVLYPSFVELYDVYIQAPGYVNFILAPLFSLTPHPWIVMLVQALMLISCLLLVYTIALMSFGRRVAIVAFILFSVLPSTLFSSAMIATEVPYLFLCLLAYWLVLVSLEKGIWFCVLAGVFYAFAYTLRPLILAFLVPSILLLLLRRKWFCAGVTLVSVLIPLFLYGYIIKKQVGIATVTSTTGGYNLLMTANDKANGLPDHTVFFRSDGIDNKVAKGCYTYSQRDSIWRKLGIEWIKNNPFKYLKLCLTRVPIMWNKDSFGVPYWGGKIPDITTEYDDFVVYQILGMLVSLPFYIICFLCFISILRSFRRWLRIRNVHLLVLFFGVGGTCLLPMEARYHFPYMWVVCIWAANEVERLRERLLVKNKASKR